MEKNNFGTFTVYYLKAKDEFITDKTKIIKIKSRDPRYSEKIQRR